MDNEVHHTDSIIRYVLNRESEKETEEKKTDGMSQQHAHVKYR